MNPHPPSEFESDVEWRARLHPLRSAPAPNLQRGRARVVAAAQARLNVGSGTRTVSFAFALGVGAAVVLMMTVMTGAFGALPVATAVLTRTDTIQAPAVFPASALTPDDTAHSTVGARQTPLPNIVPEPPRGTSFSATQTILFK